MSRSPRELECEIDKLGLTHAEFANFVSVSQRAVMFWLNGERKIPGPINVILDLLNEMPSGLRDEYILRARGLNTIGEGLYEFKLIGPAGEASGVLVIERGRVYGSAGTVILDGEYRRSEDHPKCIEVQLKARVPANTPIVLGIPGMKNPFVFEATFSIEPKASTTVDIETVFGSLEAQASFIRTIPK